jgi:hypothetical protein
METADVHACMYVCTWHAEVGQYCMPDLPSVAVKAVQHQTLRRSDEWMLDGAHMVVDIKVGNAVLVVTTPEQPLALLDSLVRLHLLNLIRCADPMISGRLDAWDSEVTGAWLYLKGSGASSVLSDRLSGLRRRMTWPCREVGDVPRLVRSFFSVSPHNSTNRKHCVNFRIRPTRHAIAITIIGHGNVYYEN